MDPVADASTRTSSDDDDLDSPEKSSAFGPHASRRRGLLPRLAEVGASAQAAIPGLYAWAITVAPAAWSRGSPWSAKIAAIVGLVALTTAPLLEGLAPVVARRPNADGGGTSDGLDFQATSSGGRAPDSGSANGASRLRTLAPFAFVAKIIRALGRSRLAPSWARARDDGRGGTAPRGVQASGALGATRARLWSVWGFVVSSAVVWALAPSAMTAVRLDGVRGALGVIGWALFAFASAGPSLRTDPEVSARIVASSPLRPRSEIPRGDGVYVAVGVALALGMQAVGWGVATPERAVLVRLVTVACGVAVLGATTSIALARHAPRVRAPVRVRVKRALPWAMLLALVVAGGFFVTSR